MLGHQTGHCVAEQMERAVQFADSSIIAWKNQADTSIDPVPKSNNASTGQSLQANRQLFQSDHIAPKNVIDFFGVVAKKLQFGLNMA